MATKYTVDHSNNVHCYYGNKHNTTIVTKQCCYGNKISLLWQQNIVAMATKQCWYGNKTVLLWQQNIVAMATNYCCYGN